MTELLQSNDYVHVIALDFSKAFDRVRHNSLASKLANVTIPDYLYNWIVNNLSGRKHQTKRRGIVSPIRSINASIIQGSALGPVEYVLTASDLLLTSSVNMLMILIFWFHLLTLHPYHQRFSTYQTGLQLIT